ncbi:hypothetical protein ACQKII_22375 [Lysinibacillus sp. NPDC048646]
MTRLQIRAFFGNKRVMKITRSEIKDWLGIKK